MEAGKQFALSIVIPCYNEQKTLRTCVESVLRLRGGDIRLELIIVDDCSKDGSYEIAKDLARTHPDVRVLHHEKNEGKGAALRTGFKAANGDFVAVQDADLEYDPMELLNLLEPLRDGRADVVYGSRFMGGGSHRVLYFWHSVGNKFLTLLSNMFTDLTLTDMETCYKVFKREVIQSIDIEENRFGFEPEITAKIAHRKLRIYEMGISYYGRTYEEGKKIGWKDGFRALYCIVKYNSRLLPAPMQFLVYLLIGGISALVNIIWFAVMLASGAGFMTAAVVSFVTAAAVNYLLCIALLFRHRAQWNTPMELLVYALVVAAGGVFDVEVTSGLVMMGFSPLSAKTLAAGMGPVFNFVLRKQFVFKEKRSPTPRGGRS